MRRSMVWLVGSLVRVREYLKPTKLPWIPSQYDVRLLVNFHYDDDSWQNRTYTGSTHKAENYEPRTVSRYEKEFPHTPVMIQETAAVQQRRWSTDVSIIPSQQSKTHLEGVWISLVVAFRCRWQQVPFFAPR